MVMLNDMNTTTKSLFHQFIMIIYIYYFIHLCAKLKKNVMGMFIASSWNVFIYIYATKAIIFFMVSNAVGTVYCNYVWTQMFSLYTMAGCVKPKQTYAHT